MIRAKALIGVNCCMKGKHEQVMGKKSGNQSTHGK